MKIRLLLETHADIQKEAHAFYAANARQPTFHETDLFVTARSAEQLVGIVRLCYEEGNYVLRTMQVRSDHQRRGIGEMILKEFERLIRLRNIEECYCIPYAHLDKFYGKIGFEIIQEHEAPLFLQTRIMEMRARNPSNKFLPCRRR